MIKYACAEKLKFRNRMAQNVSLFRLDYMLKVMKKVFDGKYSIADPQGFKSKLRLVNKQDKALKLLRKTTGASSF